MRKNYIEKIITITREVTKKGELVLIPKKEYDIFLSIFKFVFSEYSKERKMKVFLGADHRGFKLKEKIKIFLEKEKIPFEDLGNFVFDPKDDYPDFALKVAQKMAQNEKNRGILICGSGEGMAMVANKLKGIRAATAFNQKQAKTLREKNDINILSLAADYLEDKEAKRIVEVFLKTKFSGLKRHLRRINKIKKIEEKF